MRPHQPRYCARAHAQRRSSPRNLRVRSSSCLCQNKKTSRCVCCPFLMWVYFKYPKRRDATKRKWRIGGQSSREGTCVPEWWSDRRSEAVAGTLCYFFYLFIYFIYFFFFEGAGVSLLFLFLIFRQRQAIPGGPRVPLCPPCCVSCSS